MVHSIQIATAPPLCLTGITAPWLSTLQIPTWGWASIAIIVVGLAVCSIIHLRKKKEKKKCQQGGLPIWLTLTYGDQKLPTKPIFLQEEWSIGSGNDCDLVLSQSTVAPHHAMLFRRGEDVYLQDMDTQFGTYIGGMRIFAPNRLRSGEEVSLGTISFIVKFEVK